MSNGQAGVNDIADLLSTKHGACQTFRRCKPRLQQTEISHDNLIYLVYGNLNINSMRLGLDHFKLHLY